MNDDEIKEKARGIAGPSIATSFATMLAVAAGMPELAPLGVLAAPLAALFLLGVTTRKERRFSRLIAGYRSAYPGEDEDALAAEIEANASDPDFQDATYETFRLMLDALDEELVPAIGRLLRLRHRNEGLFADRRFVRNLGRLLAELDGHELAALQEIVVEVVAHPTEPMVQLREGEPGATHAHAGVVMGLLVRHFLALSGDGVIGPEHARRIRVVPKYAQGIAHVLAYDRKDEG